MKAEEGNPFLLALHIEIAAKGRKIRVPTADRQLWETAITRVVSVEDMSHELLLYSDSGVPKQLQALWECVTDVCAAQETNTKYLPSSGCFASFFIAGGEKGKNVGFKIQNICCGTLSLSHFICNENRAKAFSTVAHADTKKEKKKVQLCQRHGLKLCQRF